ncbi:MAG: hypothetical protein A3B68_04155 [Candidatus Melainabacteria bacterium RIFCSPHIGHO2_02_FULL_34_12]|nr:MAG: hypothetical protein A3B68_04155 [Candidatus Melainabacteria bacterium RIFCSPHIGHO2_02_FULL_34_12]
MKQSFPSIFLASCLLLLASCLLLLASCFLPFASFSQEPLMLTTETEDISLTDDINIARAQVAKYPDNPEARFNLAIALSRTSIVEDAIKELRKTKLLLRKPENKGVIDKKINEYKIILDTQPDAHNIKYRLAFSYYLKAYLISKEIQKSKINDSKSDNKKDKSSLNLLGSNHFVTNEDNKEIKENLNQSIYCFNNLLKSKPDDIWAKVYYGFILAEQYNEYKKARELWTDALRQNPNNPAPHFFLGELHLKEGDLKEGLTEISQAILLRSLGN